MKFLFALLAGLVFFLVCCNKPDTNDGSKNASATSSTFAEPRFAATILPLGMILGELANGRAKVTVLLPPGASPHTYEPRPSDIAAAAGAKALFWVAENLDGWAADIPAAEKVKAIYLLPEEWRLPAHEHTHSGADPEDKAGAEGDEATHGVDPHFWLDPLAVRAAVPALTAELIRLDPPGKEIYEKNAADFSARLDALDLDIAKELAPVTGGKLIVFHPSFYYFAKRYGLEIAAAIEPFPGKEPTPKYLVYLTSLLRNNGAMAIFSEPQLPREPAEAIAEAAHVKLYELDPNGGGEGRKTYEELIRYNADVLAEALK